MNYWKVVTAMLIQKYSDEDYDKLIVFLKANWASKHALYDKNIFDWQYRMYQTQSSMVNSESLVIWEDDRIVGFLGNIPNQYMFKGQLLNGAALTMWVIDEQIRNSGLGILLLRETEKNNPVTLTLGCDPKVVPLYQRMRYSYLKQLNRYVLPLEAEGYLKLLYADISISAVEEWLKTIDASAGRYDHFDSIDGVHEKDIHSINSLVMDDLNLDDVFFKKLETLFQESVVSSFAFSRYRDTDFWKWRYSESPGYRYVFLGDPQSEGIVVARVERIINNENAEIDGLKVLRIIECIPKHTDVWNGQTDPQFTNLIRKLCIWGKRQGCVAADFQISTNRLESTLLDAGFRKQKADYLPEVCSLAGLFQPFRLKVTPINFVWKVKKHGEGNSPIDPNDTYFVKSDCDMDRPNIWPLPSEWR